MLLLNPYTHDSRVRKEAASLRDAGYRVTVLAQGEHGLPRREVEDGIDVVRVERPPWPPLLRFMVHRWRMARALRRLRPDVIHAHDTETTGRVGPGLGVPIVYDAHELWLERVLRERSALYGALARWYFARVERRYLPIASAWITVSAPIAGHLERRYGIGPVEVVPNYPETNGQSATRDLRALPGGERLAADAPVVLYIGNATEGRGVEHLVAAMAEVPEAHLALLGAAGQRGIVRREARRRGVGRRVHVLPRVSPDEVVAYAASATIGVSPIPPTSLSYRYSLPNKLFQYMQAGLPVVASDYPQVREVISDAGAGVTVDPRDVGALAGAIRAYLDDPERRAGDGRRGREAVLDRLNWTTSEARLLAVYERLAPVSPGS
jgi:glycosyltransferase involved in cell wall biosynthesis